MDKIKNKKSAKIMIALLLIGCIFIYPIIKVSAAVMTSNWANNATVGYGYRTTGTYVLAVQYMLTTLEIDGANGLILTFDSSYGPNTNYAVKTFQGKYGLTVDGNVGPITWKKFKTGVRWEGDDPYGYGSYRSFTSIFFDGIEREADDTYYYVDIYDQWHVGFGGTLDGITYQRVQ